jgi:uncharacterized membrane protein (DUF106 family)
VNTRYAADAKKRRMCRLHLEPLAEEGNSAVRFFLALSSAPFMLGLALIIRWFIIYLSGTSRAHVPSLVAAAILLLSAVQLVIVGLVADLLSVNRKLLEDIQLRMRRFQLERRDEEKNSAELRLGSAAPGRNRAG